MPFIALSKSLIGHLVLHIIYYSYHHLINMRRLGKKGVRTNKSIKDCPKCYQYMHSGIELQDLSWKKLARQGLTRRDERINYFLNRRHREHHYDRDWHERNKKTVNRVKLRYQTDLNYQVIIPHPQHYI